MNNRPSKARKFKLEHILEKKYLKSKKQQSNNITEINKRVIKYK